MATAARYWRVLFRSNDNTSWSAYSYGFNHMRWFDKNNVELSASLLAAAITTNAPSYNATTFPLLNLVDASSATPYWVYYNGGTYQQGYYTYYVTFDFGTPVLPDYVLMNMATPAIAGTALACANMDFYIDSSTDNVTYTRQSMLYRPIQAFGTDYRVPAVVTSTLWPFPEKNTYGGSGGIYGIVSEDGVALPNRPVFLLERDTFFKIGYATTDENGGYAFNSLNENREYAVMSVDPSGPPYKNALIWDRITPINTKSNITPQSAFWARRIRDGSLGGLVAVKEYIDGAVYNFIGSNIVGQSERRWATPDGYNFESSLQLNETVGGALKFIKSNRTASYTGEGMLFYPSAGTFTGVNSAGIAANYTNLTFEYIFKAPTATESALIFVWGGNRESDDLQMHTQDTVLWSQSAWAAGPTLEVTPAGVVNVRFPLNGRNRSTVRATTNITPGNVYHVVLAYTQDTDIKVYVDGALVATASISAAGRLWGHIIAPSNSSAPTTFQDWDYIAHSSQANGAIRRFVVLTVAGYGNTINNSTTMRASGPGFGGAFGFAALYNRTFSASDVSAFYDSWRNWDTHTILASQSGYLGEIEADNPVFHIRMNDSAQPARINSLFGARDYTATYEGVPVYNQTGFVSGSTSVNVSAGGALLSRVDIQAVFTVEFFCRLTSVTGSQHFFVSRVYNSNAPIYLLASNGVLSLGITDVVGTVTTFTTTATLSVNTDYHIAVTYDPFNEKLFKLYVNGALVYSTAASVIPVTGNDWLGVGTNPSSTGPTYSGRVQGTMGEFTIFNYVLSAARILAHYNARNN